MAKKPSLASFRPAARPVVVVSNQDASQHEREMDKIEPPLKKKSTFEINADTAHQLSFLKLETGKSKNDLVDEALNLLFQKYGKPEASQES